MVRRVRYSSPNRPSVGQEPSSPPHGPPGALGQAVNPKALPVDSKAEREFHEGIACDLLARDGVAIVWRLHLDATKAYRDGYPRSAEVLIKVADAAEQLLLNAGSAALTRGTT
jgi:hypothetical protein